MVNHSQRAGKHLVFTPVKNKLYIVFEIFTIFPCSVYIIRPLAVKTTGCSGVIGLLVGQNERVDMKAL